MGKKKKRIIGQSCWFNKWKIWRLIKQVCTLFINVDQWINMSVAAWLTAKNGLLNTRLQRQEGTNVTVFDFCEPEHLSSSQWHNLAVNACLAISKLHLWDKIWFVWTITCQVRADAKITVHQCVSFLSHWLMFLWNAWRDKLEEAQKKKFAWKIKLTETFLKHP